MPQSTGWQLVAQVWLKQPHQFHAGDGHLATDSQPLERNVDSAFNSIACCIVNMKYEIDDFESRSLGEGISWRQLATSWRTAASASPQSGLNRVAAMRRELFRRAQSLTTTRHRKHHHLPQNHPPTAQDILTSLRPLPPQIRSNGSPDCMYMTPLCCWPSLSAREIMA